MNEIAAAADSRTEPDSRERLLYLALILITPLIQLAVNRNLFIISAAGWSWIDPWVYTGTFLNFRTFLQEFPWGYYLTRLPWVLPGVLVHRLLPPLPANYLLHLGFFYGLLFATYALVSNGVNRRMGILVTIVMAWSPIILSSLSWDYVDGAGIVFLVVTLLGLEKAAGQGRYWWGWGIAAGAGMACMASSNLFLASMSVIGMLFLVARVGLTRWRLIAGTAFLAAIGGALMLGAFSLANVMFGGPWLFLGPSFEAAKYVTSTPSNWRISGWHHRAEWLALPLAGVLGALLNLLPWGRPRLPFARAIDVSLLAAAALLTAFEARGIPLLQISYYSSYLAPLALLSLPLHVGCGVDVSRRRSIAFALWMIAFMAAAHWLFLAPRETSFLITLMRTPAINFVYGLVWPGPADQESFTTFFAVVGGLVAVLSLKFVRATNVSRFGFVLGLMFVCAAVPNTFPTQSARGVQSSFRETLEAARYVGANAANRPLRFWYDLNGNPTRSLRPIASMYFWSRSLINETLPTVSAAELKMVEANAMIVFLVPTAQDLERARESLRTHGFDVALVDQKAFGEGDRFFSVVLANLVALPAARPGN
jgi:hypothetical protein